VTVYSILLKRHGIEWGATDMSGALWSATGECVIALIFLAYGLTDKPLHFNRFDLWKKPLSVWGARLIYIPIGALFLVLGIRDLAHAVR